MADLLDFCAAQRKQSVHRIISEIGTIYGKAAENIEAYRLLIQEDPAKAIEQLPDFIDQARNANPERAYEAMAGGPNQDFVAPLINAVGPLYPALPREARLPLLRKIFNYLDSLNYFNAQDHVELIHEPWLVGDILTTRPLYSPGYKTHADFLEKNRNWQEVAAQVDKSRSKFFFSLALIQPKISSLEVRTRFYEQFPVLLDRTLDAVAGFIIEHARNRSQRENLDLEQEIARKFTRYDPPPL